MSLEALRIENEQLKRRIAELEARPCGGSVRASSALHSTAQTSSLSSSTPVSWSAGPAADTVPSASGLHHTSTLSLDAYERYSRQLILPELRLQGQCALLASSVLVVGAGGLGCSAAQYLAAAGVGTLGLVDYDTVELSNLHRQILHCEATIGMAKVESARQRLQALNSSISVVAHHCSIDSTNVLDLARPYDVIVDASDNVATRYLLNDVAVLLKKPLVSGSALRLEGQCTVYNYQGGPCFRCIHPQPPPATTVANCSDAGVLGAVVGMIGSVQALEAIKVITGQGTTLSQRLLIFDGMSSMFRVVKLRARQATCSVCGDNPTISAPIDYVQFCGAGAHDKEPQRPQLDQSVDVSCARLAEAVRASEPHVLLDVRESVQYELCHLSHAKNIPLKELASRMEEVRRTLLQATQQATNHAAGSPSQTQQASFAVATSSSSPHSPTQPVIYCVCRRGIDSLAATNLLRSAGFAATFNVHGGMQAWSKEVDPSFPRY